MSEPTDDLITDTLWLLGKRDNTGGHAPDYWGNFAPQVVAQSLRRFTQPDELIIDPFVGYGTTLIEAVRHNRYAIGVDLNPDCTATAHTRAASPRAVALTGDSTDPSTVDAVRAQMTHWGFAHAHLLMLHPPYHNIIRFSDHPADLSNAPTTEAFLERFGQVVRNFAPLLENGRFAVLVIGDRYTRGEWVPLGFYTMQAVLQHGFRLKSICIKDIHEPRGKRHQHRLWRYRALKHNFFVFAHEYVMFFERRAP